MLICLFYAAVLQNFLVVREGFRVSLSLPRVPTPPSACCRPSLPRTELSEDSSDQKWQCAETSYQENESLDPATITNTYGKVM